jgi:hypothetical protein
MFAFGGMMSDVRSSDESRDFPRFVPSRSVSAAILGDDGDVVHGVVSNVSETGVALVTNRPMLGTTDIDLRLSQDQRRILDIRAKIVWRAEGVSTSGDVVGNLLGLSFADQSTRQREEIRRFFWSPDINKKGNRSKERKHFDELVDPHVEKLFKRNKKTAS